MAWTVRTASQDDRREAHAAWKKRWREQHAAELEERKRRAAEARAYRAELVRKEAARGEALALVRVVIGDSSRGLTTAELMAMDRADVQEALGAICRGRNVTGRRLGAALRAAEIPSEPGPDHVRRWVRVSRWR